MIWNADAHVTGLSSDDIGYFIEVSFGDQSQRTRPILISKRLKDRPDLFVVAADKLEGLLHAVHVHNQRIC